MHRKTTVIVLVSGLISAQNIFASDVPSQSRGTDRPGIRNSHSGINEKKSARLQQKNPGMVVRESGFRDVAMRFSDEDMPSPNLKQKPPVDEGTDSWFAMLVAGFGVALVSIIRRMGSIR